jgi:hypothetical protein
LEPCAPLSRDGLEEGAVVKALWGRAADRDDVGQSLYIVWLILCDDHDAAGNPKLYEVKTALTFVGCGEFRTSAAFE